ncbi:natural killer cells antigen CD94-like [Brachionichthys hirsutus]|uniref:natural killer cells antigen CD94-like n=1 Tax=Brachionichthys hirsutus TaxID=412623 RepID=UPI0036046D82
MEEELNYSTVAFKDGGQPPKEKREEPTIYAEVKHKESTSTPASNGEAAAARSYWGMLAVCLVILCVLLASSVSGVIYITRAMDEQKAIIGGLAAENQQLMLKKSDLERETWRLSRLAGHLNWTLGVILEFNTFPVTEYCPEKKCQPCKEGWLMFQEKCYLFYDKRPPWKTWDESKKYCEDSDSNLVVIDGLQEQKFISNHSNYYYDELHGYWLGLYEDDGKNWVWVDGRRENLGYWMQGAGTAGPRALLIPGRNLTACWDTADSLMRNKLICERKVLLRPN